MIVLLVVFVLAFAFRTPTGKQEGGRVADASRFVHTQARGGSDGRFLITSVSRPGFGDPQLSSARIAMRASQKSAIAAASDCLRPRTAISATISSEGLTGGSAGLMFALTVVDAHDTSDLTRGRRIAGTGTILEDGAVGPVLHVGVKARAAERAGADLFLVPETQIVQARSATDSMPVAGVRTLDEAVRVLTGSGCSR